MPTFCAAIGCGRRGDRDGRAHSFYRLPCIPKRGDKTLKTKRRMKWILALRRADMTETKLKYIVVCDRHFISGKPANVWDIENPDWVPSINMGYDVEPDPKQHSTKPLVEYLKSSTANDSSQSSSNADDAEESIINSNVAGVTETGDSYSISDPSMLLDQDMFLDDNSDEEYIPESDEEYIPEKYNLHKKLKKTKKNSVRKKTSVERKYGVGDMLSEENILRKYVLSEWIGDESEFHGNMLSKKVQTDITMIDLENMASAFKASVTEMNQLKTKLNLLQRDESYDESFDILLQN